MKKFELRLYFCILNNLIKRFGWPRGLKRYLFIFLHSFCMWCATHLKHLIFSMTYLLHEKFSLPQGIQGSIPSRKGPFFSILQHPWHHILSTFICSKYAHLFGQAEKYGTWPCQIRSFLYFYLIAKYVVKINLLLIPVFNFKNILGGSI